MPCANPSLDVYRARVGRAIAYIQDNLAGELSLDGAAEAACFSKYHFHRIFSAATGESFADCVRRLRLERAANLLEQRPGLSVTEAAMAAGFSSPSVLSRLFAERFGIPPSEWRESRSAGRPGPEATPRPWLEAEAKVGKGGSLELSLRRLPALRFASCLHVGPYGQGIGEAWSRLSRWAGPRGLFGAPEGGPSPGGARPAGVSWDNPDICAPERCRYSACLEIPEDLEPSGDVLLLTFPARAYLVLHYQGPESSYSEAYARLYREFLPASGLEPEDDPVIEFYRSMNQVEAAFDVDLALPVRELR